jgi:hypothetical protein
MRVSSKNLFIAVIFAAGLVLLSACETGPASKPGLYENKEYRFTVKYPENWKRFPVGHQGELCRAGDESGLPSFNIVIGEISKGVALKDFPKGVPANQKRFFPSSSDHKIVHEKMIELEDGTQAVEYDIEWNYLPDFKLTTTSVTTYKDNKRITINSSCMYGTIPIDKLKQITHSLKFYK